MDTVPSAIIALIDSPPTEMARTVANSGDEPTMGADLETPTRLTPVKLSSRPRGKLIKAESRNQRNAGAVSSGLSKIQKMIPAINANRRAGF